jgi:hypothetical protein
MTCISKKEAPEQPGLLVAWRFSVAMESDLLSSRDGPYRTFEWIGQFRRDLSLRPKVMPIAVRTKRLRLKIREALEALPVGLDAGLNKTTGPGTLDQELEHQHDGISMRYR